MKIHPTWWVKEEVIFFDCLHGIYHSRQWLQMLD